MRAELARAARGEPELQPRGNAPLSAADLEGIAAEHATRRSFLKAAKPTTRAVRAARRRARSQVLNRLTPMRAAGWLLLVGVAGAVAFFAVDERDAVAAAWPEAASAYRVVGLEAQGGHLRLEGVERSLFVASGAPRIEISGHLVNGGEDAVSSPMLLAEARDADGAPVALWTFSPDASRLEPGAAAEFRTEGAFPADAVEVIVAFADRPGAMAR